MLDTKYLILTVGLPRSGKSSWAHEFSQDYSYPIVNPDSIRFALHGHPYLREAESFVWAITRCQVSSLFISGYRAVILDATNCERKRRDEWQSANWVTLFKFFDVSVEECQRRARESNRSDLVAVIERMFLNFDPLGANEKLLEETCLGTGRGSRFELCKKIEEQELEIESLRAQLEYYKS